jgi:hypothetical protein
MHTTQVEVRFQYGSVILVGPDNVDRIPPLWEDGCATWKLQLQDIPHPWTSNTVLTTQGVVSLPQASPGTLIFEGIHAGSRMKSAALAVVILLVVTSGALGYYIGATWQGGTPRDSSSTASGGIPTYQLSILAANWTNQYTTKSGSCGITSLSHFNPATGGYYVGPPEASCDAAVGPSEAGNVTLKVTNSGNGTSIMFEDSSSYPSEVFFLNSQGCGSPGGIGLCYIAGHANATFGITFESVSGTYTPTNVTLDIVVAALAPA